VARRRGRLIWPERPSEAGGVGAGVGVVGQLPGCRIEDGEKAGRDELPSRPGGERRSLDNSNEPAAG